MGIMDFSNTEKLDILLKDSFNVPSTNENIAWYLETNADYSTWTNGSDILLDTFATSNVWASSTSLNSTKMNDLYGLSSSDFASGGGIEESADGLLHKFVKLKLEGVPGTKQSGTNNFYAYYKKNGSENILEDGFQKTFGDGTSFNYQLFTQSNSNVELQPTGSNGNWFFNFKNGILFFPDPDATNIVNSIKEGSEPYFTFVKYVGKKKIPFLKL